MAIIWFTDEDRERMRRENEAALERQRLFWEFVQEVQPFRVADREHKASPRIEMLDIRPWPNRPDEER